MTAWRRSTREPGTGGEAVVPDRSHGGRRSAQAARIPRRWDRWPLLLLLLVAVPGGCATALQSIPVSGTPEEDWCCAGGDEFIHVRYLGVGGWLFRMGDAALLTAPFYSNPGLLDVGVGRIEADTARIDAHLPEVGDVEAVLVGHAHYDHLMDVPYVLRAKAPSARMYGSRTAVNLLLGDPGIEAERLVSVEEGAGDHQTPGEWIHVAGGRIRFMALRSGHASHFLGIHLYQGQLEEPASELPTRAGGWVEGTPLAYLIDFLSEEGEVVFRVHYQDAASTPPAGFPPPVDGIPVDLAILCPPGYEEVDGYPEGILLHLEPRNVLLGHWEDFFRPQSEPLRGVPGTDMETFVDRMEAVLPSTTAWRFPEPGSEVRFRPTAPRDR